MGIGVEDGGHEGSCPPPPKKIREKYFSGKNHVKFGNFVNFSCIYLRAKMSCPQSWLSSYAYGNVLQLCIRMDRYPSTQTNHISCAVACTKAIQLQTALLHKELERCTIARLLLLSLAIRQTRTILLLLQTYRSKLQVDEHDYGIVCRS